MFILLIGKGFKELLGFSGDPVILEKHLPWRAADMRNGNSRRARYMRNWRVLCDLLIMF